VRVSHSVSLTFVCVFVFKVRRPNLLPHLLRRLRRRPHLLLLVGVVMVMVMVMVLRRMLKVAARLLLPLPSSFCACFWRLEGLTATTAASELLKKKLKVTTR
jgi:hypothetical protein